MRKLAFCICKTKMRISWAVTAQLISAVTAQLISAFVFAILIVQSIFNVHPKFPASSNLLWLHSPICAGPRRNHDRFSHNEDQLETAFVLIKNPENPRNINVVVINKDT